jgi:hypothetical protein
MLLTALDEAAPDHRRGAGRTRRAVGKVNLAKGHDGSTASSITVELELVAIVRRYGGGRTDAQLQLGDQRPRVGRGFPRLGDDLPSIGRDVPKLGRCRPDFGHHCPSFGHHRPNFGRAVPNIGRDVSNLGRHRPWVGHRRLDLGDTSLSVTAVMVPMIATWQSHLE